MKRFISHSTAETEAFGAEFAQTLKGGDVVAMFGGMGMGKTAFVRGMAKGLEICAEVSTRPMLLFMNISVRAFPFIILTCTASTHGTIWTPRDFFIILPKAVFWLLSGAKT